MKFKYSLLAAAMVFAAPASAASIIGETVNVSARYPTSQSIYSNPGDRVVTDGVEYATGAFANYNGSFSVDVRDNSFVINSNSPIFFGTAAFNGFVLQLRSVTQFVSASVDPTSDLNPVDLSFDSDEIFVNFSGAQSSAPWSTTINFGTDAVAAVPEPATWLLMLMGFGAVGFGMRRSKQQVKTTVSYA